MPSLNSMLLVLIALLLAAVNLWHAAVRSTIPLAINDSVRDVEVRGEKHPGKDDVYLIQFSRGDVLQVDQQIAKEIAIGNRVWKQAWSRNLHLDLRSVDLAWSDDYHGMTTAMPAILIVIVATATCVALSVRR